MQYICIYSIRYVILYILSMYLSQAVSLPAWIRIQSDLFLCTHLVQEVQLEHAVVTCRIVAPTYPVVLVHPNHERRAQSRPVQSRIARDPPLLVIGGAPGV